MIWDLKQMKGNEYQDKSNIENSLDRRKNYDQKFRQNWQSILKSVGLRARKFQVYFLFIMLTAQGIVFIIEATSDQIDIPKLIGGIYLISLSFFWFLILFYLRRKKKNLILHQQKSSCFSQKSPNHNRQLQQMNSSIPQNLRISQQIQNQNQQETKSIFQQASFINKQPQRNQNSRSSCKIQQKERNSVDLKENNHKKSGYYLLVRDLLIIVFSTPAVIYIYEYFLDSIQKSQRSNEQEYCPAFWTGVLTLFSFKLFISRLKIPFMQIIYFLSGYSYFIVKYWICCGFKPDTIVISLIILFHQVTLQATDIFKVRVYSFFKKYSKHQILFEALRLTVEQGDPKSDLENDLATRFIKLQSQHKRENEIPLNYTPKHKISQSIQLAQQNSIQNKSQQFNPQQINDYQASKAVMIDKNQSGTSFMNNTSYPLRRQGTFNQRINDLKMSGFYSQLFSLIPVGVAIISSGKNLLYASTQMLQMLNCQDEQKALKILLNLNTNAQKSTQFNAAAEEEIESEDDQQYLNGQTDYTSSINANYNSIFNGYNNSDKKQKKEIDVSNNRFTPPQLNQKSQNGFQMNNQSIRDNSAIPSGLVEEERSSRYMIDEEEDNSRIRRISMNAQNMNGQSYSNNNSIVHVNNPNYRTISYSQQHGSFKEQQQIMNIMKSPQNSVNETMIEIGTERNNLINYNLQNTDKQQIIPVQPIITSHAQHSQNNPSKKIVKKSSQNLSSNKELNDRWITDDNALVHQAQQSQSQLYMGRTSYTNIPTKHLQQNHQPQLYQQQQQDSLGDTDKQIIEEDELGQTQSIINPELQLNELQFQRPEYSKMNSPKSGVESTSQKKRGSGIMRNNLRQMSYMKYTNDNASDNKTEAQQREESVLNILNIMLGWQDQQQQNNHTPCLQNQQVSSAKIKSQKKIINQQMYYTSNSVEPDIINSPQAASIGHQVQSTTYGKGLSYNQSTMASHSLNQIQAKQQQESIQTINNELISNSLAKQLDVNREKQPTVKINQQLQSDTEQAQQEEQNPFQDQINAKQIPCQNNVPSAAALSSNNTCKKKQGDDAKDFDELLKQKQQLGYIQQEGNVSTMQIEYLGEQYILKIIIHQVIVGSSGEQQKVAMIVMEKMWQDFMIKKVEDLIKQKMQLFGSLSHELRTPLNCSISMMEVLQNIAQSEQNHQSQLLNYIQPALNSNKLLLNMINDILDFVQLENGSFKFGYVEFDLQNLLKECVSLVQIQAKMKNLTIACYFDPQTPKIIKSDPNRIRQVILNFLSNALKFTIAGHIIVYASAHKGIQEVTIGVKDTGIGINQENINEIFKIFNKIDLGNNSKLNLQGCGVGLALSNSIARALGPQDNQGIQVQSEKNHGSNFSFVVQNQNPPISNKEEDIYENEDVSNERLFANFSIIRPQVTQINKDKDLLQHFQTKRRHSNISLNSNQANIKGSIRQTRLQSQTSNSNQITNSISNSIINGCQNNNNNIQQINYNHNNHAKTLTNLNTACKDGQNDGMSFSSDNSLQINAADQNLKMRSISLTQISLSQRKNIINSYSSVAQEQQSPKDFQQKPKQAHHYFYNNNNSTIGNPQSPSRNHSQYGQMSFVNVMSVGEKKVSLLETIKSKDFQDMHLLDHQKYESPAGFNSYYEEKDSQVIKRSLECIQNNIIQFGCNCPQILIVDDQEFNLFSLSQLLKQFYGIISDTAINFPQVMEKIQSKLNSKCCKTYRIIFMDINMPQKSGYEVAREIKFFYNNNEILEQIKPTIIACSAYNGEEDKKKAYTHGMVDFVTKPIMKAALDAIISKYYDSTSLIPQQLLNN
ncbi:ATPase, histidine kinase-, DNA gyrase B (macronuclear) [Tetrahymena thermophila SB210]|uniref:histidine kinase n=1 Tax=Tetrahymena thermophila (strain SB210) TaxID=312017 RepID=I7LZD8_TETTS|nr:ATPase, histidine kinase-, DNA gyrase B [Tetrahymena thermophila SB210]EAR83324.2 ATPase, histidine kinase-, DNA gyrase B [Tetrahymena thermophila SB210]|eukprot:XP_001030987.2 ATPase, histidine kinase-, DNA gyrase B [Tetrahymena thermophila SB210]